MSLYNGPPRPGARGGRGEFSWDNVKADKDREYYLGHSVKATTGRWAKGKDVFWYTKAGGAGGVSSDELQAVKQQERDMMAEALGLKPKPPPSSRGQPALEKHEVDKLLKGGGGGDAEQPAALEGARVQGLGFGGGTGVAVREEVHEVLQGTGMPAAATAAAAAAAAGGRAVGAAAAGREPGMLTVEQLAALDKADRRAAKKAKKAAKKAKKDSKSKRKHKHRSRSRSASSSSSDSEGQRQHKRGRQQKPPPPPSLQPRSERHVLEEQQRLPHQPDGDDRGKRTSHFNDVGWRHQQPQQQQQPRHPQQSSRQHSRSPQRHRLRTRSPQQHISSSRSLQQQRKPRSRSPHEPQRVGGSPLQHSQMRQRSRSPQERGRSTLQHRQQRSQDYYKQRANSRSSSSSREDRRHSQQQRYDSSREAGGGRQHHRDSSKRSSERYRSISRSPRRGC